MSWYRLAAEQGIAAAQLNLGLMYGKGEHVPQDLVQAYFWLSLAAAQDNADEVQSRNYSASLMTPVQIVEAERLAREWKPKAAQ